MNARLRQALCLAALAVLVSGIGVPRAWAQALATGRIDAVAADQQGAAMPGVTVEISGPLSLSSVTDAAGEAHFLNLPPGIYRVRASIPGFAEYANDRVQVDTGRAVQLPVTMRVAGVSEAVQVSSAAPVVDLQKQNVATNVTLAELQNLPSSRDPWVVLQTVPGVVVDRVNVGGGESGQQSFYIAKGANTGDNTWTLDGIPITDMSALGGSPTYYDFDMFQEMQISTGGSDVQNSTPGAQLNMTLKNGTNRFAGSSRVYFTNESLQGSNLPAEATNLAGASGKGNRTDQYADYGFEIGGPVVRDRLFAWGSIGITDTRILTLTNVLDKTNLENYAFKTNGQFNANTRASFTYFRGNKIKDGRGASATRPTETTWDQDGPTDTFKGEVNLVVGSNLFLVGRAAYVKNQFVLDPKGGVDGLQPFRDTGRVYHNNYYYYSTERPSQVYSVDGNYFKGRHELKFGFSHRPYRVDSTLEWPGGGLTQHSGSYATTGNMLFIGIRPYDVRAKGVYTAGYIGDTISWDRLTLNAAIRWDRQTSSSLETSIRANPIAPGTLAGFTAPALENAITFNNPGPRVGVNYSLDESRKTQVRASYAMFASQLNAGDATFGSAATYAYAYWNAVDVNRNGSTEANELRTFLGAVAVDTDNPTSTTSVNRIAGDLKSPVTHELLFGVDREVMNNFGVSASVTYRRFNNLIWKPLIGVRSDDYELGGYVEGSNEVVGSYRVPYYELRESALPPGGGREYSTREGYHQRYWGFEAQAVKRMSDRWMARLGFSWNDHREYFTDPAQAIEDPTANPGNNGNTNETGYLKKDGGVVVQEGTSGKEVYITSPKFQVVANGAYEAPFGVNFAVNMVTRQGFGTPYFALVDTLDPAVPQKEVAVVDNADDFRLPTVTSFDFRVSKPLRLGAANVTVDFDVFNVGNVGTVLRRQYDIDAVGATGFNRILEIMNPRIARFGVRVNW